MNIKEIEERNKKRRAYLYTPTDHCLMDEIDYLLAELKKREWVPVSERLPEAHTLVFLYDGVAVHCGEWDTYKFIFYTGMPSFVPSHWMPLPEPPPEQTV